MGKKIYVPMEMKVEEFQMNEAVAACDTVTYNISYRGNYECNDCCTSGFHNHFWDLYEELNSGGPNGEKYFGVSTTTATGSSCLSPGINGNGIKTGDVIWASPVGNIIDEWGSQHVTADVMPNAVSANTYDGTLADYIAGGGYMPKNTREVISLVKS